MRAVVERKMSVERVLLIEKSLLFGFVRIVAIREKSVFALERMTKDALDEDAWIEERRFNIDMNGPPMLANDAAMIAPLADVIENLILEKNALRRRLKSVEDSNEEGEDENE